MGGRERIPALRGRHHTNSSQHKEMERAGRHRPTGSGPPVGRTQQNHLPSTTTATPSPTAAHQAACQWPPSISTPGSTLWNPIAFRITLTSTQRHLTPATTLTPLPLGGGQGQSELKHAEAATK